MQVIGSKRKASEVKITSKKAIAKAIALKLFSPEMAAVGRKALLYLVEKLLNIRAYLQIQIFPLVRYKMEQTSLSLRQLKWETAINHLKKQPKVFFNWVSSRRLPPASQVFAFAGQEVVANVVAWTAALISSQFISHYYTAKNWKNVWGVFANKEKTMISQETYDIIDWMAAYLIGLLMLLSVNHLINKLYEYMRNKDSQS